MVVGETIEWAALADLPGLTVLRVRNSEQRFRAFHEHYVLCNVPCDKARGTEWIYRGRVREASRGTMLFEPGEMHVHTRLYGGAASYDVLFLDPTVVHEASRDILCHPAVPHLPRAIVDDRRLYEAAAKLSGSFDVETTTLARQYRLACALELLVRGHSERRSARARAGWEQAAVARARDYLHEHVADNVSLDELSTVAGLSRFHLVRVFKHATGLPPHEYQLVTRVWTAARLLAQGERPAHVAPLLGFADRSHFGRHFRRIMRVSPGTYAASVGRRTISIGRAGSP